MAKKYYKKVKKKAVPKPKTFRQQIDDLKEANIDDISLPKERKEPVKEEEVSSVFREVKIEDGDDTPRIETEKVDTKVERGGSGYENFTQEEIASDQAIRIRNIDTILTEILSILSAE